MAVRAISDYDFPSRSRQELYGDDQLVNVWWKNNPWFAAAACVRAPRQMTWGQFRAQLIDPAFAADPDFGPSVAFEWWVDDEPVRPGDGQTLTDLGIGHKSLVTCRSIG